MSSRQPIGLHIRKCDLCGTVNIIEGQSVYYDLHKKCQCGRALTLRAVVGRVTEHQCGVKCTSAVGPSCDCECGGKRHGEDHRTVKVAA